MKKFLALVAGVSLCGVAAADNHVVNPGDQVVDRVNGTYRIQCTGERVDNGQGEDWRLSKEDLGYVTYGKISHSLIGGVNQRFGEDGNEALQILGLPPIVE